MKAAFGGLIRRYNKGVDRRNELLIKNMNSDLRHDIIMFHAGEIPQARIDEVTARCSAYKFVDISDTCYKVPDHVDDSRLFLKGHSHSRLGYLHMCQFYSMQIYDFLDDYDYFSRVDDDSFIETELGYDLFDHMRDNDVEFLYRVTDIDNHKESMNCLPNLVHEYVKERDIEIKGDWKFIDPKLTKDQPDDTRYGSDGGPSKGLWKKGIHGWSSKCHSVLGYYSNFYATDLSFWRRPDVRDFLDYVSASGFIYYNRLGDQLVQTAALQLFACPDKISRNKDFQYTHCSHNVTIPVGT